MVKRVGASTQLLFDPIGGKGRLRCHPTRGLASHHGTSTLGQ